MVVKMTNDITKKYITKKFKSEHKLTLCHLSQGRKRQVCKKARWPPPGISKALNKKVPGMPSASGFFLRKIFSFNIPGLKRLFKSFVIIHTFDCRKKSNADSSKYNENQSCFVDRFCRFPWYGGCKVIRPNKSQSWMYGRLQYSRRPILSDRCFKCHGPDGNKRKAGLRFDIVVHARIEKATKRWP